MADELSEWPPQEDMSLISTVEATFLLPKKILLKWSSLIASGISKQDGTLVNFRIRKALATGVRLWKWLFQPSPRRFLAVWYTAWLGVSLKACVVNWLI